MFLEALPTVATGGCFVRSCVPGRLGSAPPILLLLPLPLLLLRLLFLLFTVVLVHFFRTYTRTDVLVASGRPQNPTAAHRAQ